MNVIDVYKKLPKRNCGECPQKTCMAFALALVKGVVDVEACPYLDAELREELGRIRGEDWREKLISELREEVSGIDFSECAGSLGAELVDGSMRIKCIGTDYLIAPDGAISTDGYINPWIRILLLHYIRTGGSGPLSGKWISFAELKAGMVKASSFHRDCEEPLREMLDRNLKVTEGLLYRLGAVKVANESSDHAWQLYLLPKIPVLILYWTVDDDSEDTGLSAVKILFDSTADRFLDVESLIFLVEGLINIIEHVSSAG
jgi:hypothetical protein